MRRALLAVTIALASGCGLARASARVQLDRARVAHAATVDAERRAPVPYERFEARLREAAQSSAKDGARAVLASEARMWLEVAIADAERLELAERRLEEERGLVALDAEIVALERARRALADDNARRAAQAIARDEAQKALARAAQKPAQRVKLAREDAQRAAVAVRRQATLIALTAASLGGAESELSRVTAKLAEVDALLPRDPEASLTRADEALSLAQASLALLRQDQHGPDALEKSALAEALSASGARTEAGDHGLAGTVDAAFREGALSAPAARILARLCALAQAHPHGPIRLAVDGQRGAQAEARVRAVRKRLGEAGCSGERFVIEPAAREGDLVEARWLAY